MPGGDPRNGGPCVRFKLGTRVFGIPLSQIQEVATLGHISTVPLAPPAVRGIASWRGRVITLIDVATLTQCRLPPIRSDDQQLALILTPPYAHIGAYVHGPVEIGSIAAEPVSSRSGAHPDPPSFIPGRDSAASAAAEDPAVTVLDVDDLMRKIEVLVLDTVMARSSA